jgi:hypothetical protein
LSFNDFIFECIFYHTSSPQTTQYTQNKIRSTKFEIRNKFKILMFKIQNKSSMIRYFRVFVVLVIWISVISVFEFRIFFKTPTSP